MAVTTLLAMPSAQGLFTRVIAQSGVGDRVIVPHEDAAKVTQELARRVGVPPNREGFGAVRIPKLYSEQFDLTQDIPKSPMRWGRIGITMMPFAPVLDEDSLPLDPLDAVQRRGRRGRRAGAGQQHGRAPVLPRPAGLHRPARGRLRQRRAPDLRRAAGHLRAAYDERYSTPGELFAAAASDFFFRLPDIRLAEARGAGSARTWMYEFAWRSPLLRGPARRVPLPRGAVRVRHDRHAERRPRHRRRAAAGDRRRDAPALAGVRRRPATRDGRRYTPERRAVMTFDLESGVVDDPRSEQRVAWPAPS